MEEFKSFFITVKTEDYEISIPINKRITYLKGNSSAGKTAFVKLVDAKVSSDDPDIYLSKPNNLSIEYVSVIGIKTYLEGIKNCIVLLDDNLGTEVPDFHSGIGELLLKNNLFVVIINRVDVFEKSAEQYSGKFEYDARSILWVKKIRGKKKRVVSSLVDELGEYSEYNKISTILCEDKYGMTNFCNRLKQRNIFVTHSDGKDNVIDFLNNLIELGTKGDIFVYADLIRFGRYISLLYSIARILKYDIVIDNDYLSFEYFILNTNVFKEFVDLNPGIIYNGIDIDENYYENLLEKISRNYIGRPYTHGEKVPNCLIKDCEDCKYNKYCDKYQVGDKLSLLVDNTVFEYIKKLLKGE